MNHSPLNEAHTLENISALTTWVKVDKVPESECSTDDRISKIDPILGTWNTHDLPSLELIHYRKSSQLEDEMIHVLLVAISAYFRGELLVSDVSGRVSITKRPYKLGQSPAKKWSCNFITLFSWPKINGLFGGTSTLLLGVILTQLIIWIREVTLYHWPKPSPLGHTWAPKPHHRAPLDPSQRKMPLTSFRKSTWRIILFSKWLVTPIYKPCRSFVRGRLLTTY